MPLLASFLELSFLALSVWYWREHKRTYYELEKSVERRLGPVRGAFDGVCEFAYTTSGLIPQLDRIANKYGSDLIDEERALMQRSRTSYYFGGTLMLLSFLGALSLIIWLN